MWLSLVTVWVPEWQPFCLYSCMIYHSINSSDVMPSPHQVDSSGKKPLIVYQGGGQRFHMEGVKYFGVSQIQKTQPLWDQFCPQIDYLIKRNLISRTFVPCIDNYIPKVSFGQKHTPSLTIYTTTFYPCRDNFSERTSFLSNCIILYKHQVINLQYIL